METFVDDTPVVMQVPHSPNTEEALLGALILDSQQVYALAVAPEDFYIIRNRFIFQAIDHLARAGRQVDYVTLCGRLDEVKLLADIGGPAEIIRLMASCQPIYNAPEYARILKEKARRRSVIEAAQRLTQAAFDGQVDVGAAITDAMLTLSRTVTVNKGARPLREAVSRVYDEISDAIEHPNDTYGIPTGILDWDMVTHGLQRGTVVKLSGEPGIGKSLLACQVLAYAAEKKHPGALYEFEMGAGQVVRRLLSAEAKVTTHAMRSGRIADNDMGMFVAAIDKLSALPVYMCADTLTTQEMRADLHRLKDQFGIELAVVDYEALLADLPDADETARSLAISSRVHSIAKDLDLAMLVIDDMNKAGIAGTTKGKAGLAGSARKLHDADEIIIMRASPEQPDVVLLNWEKNREGSNVGCVSLLKSRKFPSFGNMTSKKESAFAPIDRKDYE